MLVWLSANWIPLASAAYVLVNEIVALSPLKSNSVVQLILAVLKSVIPGQIPPAA